MLLSMHEWEEGQVLHLPPQGFAELTVPSTMAPGPGLTWWGDVGLQRTDTRSHPAPTELTPTWEGPSEEE